MSETMTMEGKTWTAERDAQLRKLHATGLSTRKIGAEMGLSGNAVIGRIHRLGIQRGGQGRSAVIRKKRVLAPKVALPATVKAKPLPPTGLRALVDDRKREAPKPLPVEPERNGCRVSLNDLQPHQCKFPLGDTRDEAFGFCGADRVEGRPYCAEHVARAYISGSYLPRWLTEKAA